MPHTHHPRPTANDRLYESFYSGAIGGTTVALFFLVLDTLSGRPLHTPALLGGSLIGATIEAAPGDDLTAVALITLIHFAGFAAFGFVAAPLVRLIERHTEGSFIFPGVALLLFLQGAFVATGMLFVPGALDALGQGPVLAANVLAAVSMTAFLRHAHCSSETESRPRPSADATDLARTLPPA